MPSPFRCSLILACLAIAVTRPAAAQIPFSIGDPCCAECRQAAAVCECSTVRPIVETRLRQQQVVSYRDVTETQYRQETYTETIPVITREQVTVDEGCYQTVWVPKPVVREVARTTYQQQLRSRAVPVQVTRRIPQVTTRLVPQQTVRFAAQHVSIATAAPCSICDPAMAHIPAPASVMPLPQFTTTAILPPHPAPLPQLLEPQFDVAAPPPTPAPLAANGGGPGSLKDYDEWVTIEPKPTLKSSRNAPLDSYAPPASRISVRQAAPPAPTAATVSRYRDSVQR